MRVATYCRISDDREGKALGVQRQREDCEWLVQSRGWTLAARYVDNDLSAYSGKVRPGYSQLLDAVRGGLIDGIVAWHPDRLHRSPRELEDFLTVVEQHGVAVETVRAGKWDLSTPSGRMTARILGSVARGESEHKSDRVRRALEQRASMGASHGRVAYGWTRSVLPDGTKVETVNEPQAALVRDLAQRIVRGESLRGIVTDLNAGGIPSPTGKEWGKTMLRHLVTRERNVALRVHRGEVVGPGEWPPILERGLWEQVRAVLTDPTRKTSTSSAAVHLLSGLARCGVCGGTMRASLNRTVPSYRCADKSCVSRNRRDVDEFVTGVVLARLARADVAGLLAPVDDGTRRAAAEVAELRSRLDNAADDYADGTVDREQFHRISERLRPRLEAAQARARVVDSRPLLAEFIGAEDARKVWEALPLSRQRGVVDLLVSIRVLRAAPGARVFDPATVEVTWKRST
ncbi:MAG: Resolvase domain protein [Frankiales bacterium]|nr:Resolvase domain protein [Frankiales bacterium]